VKPIAISLREIKAIAGNFSSPATEDTGTKPEVYLFSNKQAQGVIKKIFYNQGTWNIGDGPGF